MCAGAGDAAAAGTDVIETAHVVGNRARPDLVDHIVRAGCRPVLLDARSRDETRTEVRRVVAQGATRVVVLGGDGIVHDVIQELAGTRVVLGIVPLGTGNDTARAFGLPLRDARAAMDRALEPGRPVDLIRTPHGYVASVVTSGFSARVNERANQLARPKGSLKYTLATLTLLPSLRSERVTITVDGVAGVYDSTLVAIANTRYFGGGMAICPSADPTDGQIDVAVVGKLSRAALLRFFPSVFSGRHARNKRVTFLRGAVVTIEGGGAVMGDGEPLGPMPCRCEIVPSALLIASLKT